MLITRPLRVRIPPPASPEAAMHEPSPRQRTRRALTLALLAGLLLISLGIVLLMPPSSNLEAQAQVMAARLDRALERDARAPGMRIAVLPFAATGPAAGDLDYLRQALAEAVTEQLAAQSQLRLAGRRSVQAVADAALSEAMAAQVLGADYLLIGALHGDQEAVQVRVRLWNAATGAEEWIMQFQGGGATLQELPWKVAERLRATFPDSINFASEPNARPLSAADYHDFLMASYLARRGNAEDLRRALEILDRLRDRAPGHLPSILAHARAQMSLNAITGDHWPDVVSALSHVERELLPGMAAEPSVLGLAALAAFYRAEWSTAIERIEQAVALDPNDAQNIMLAAQLMLGAGYIERAAELGRQVALLDPVATQSHQFLALVHGVRGDDAAMVRHAEIGRDLGLDTAGYYLGFAEMRAGRIEPGVEYLRAALQAAGGPVDWLPALAAALRDGQARSAAVAAMDRVGPQERAFMDEFFVYYAKVGAIERSLQALRAVADDGYGQWTMFVWLPELAGVRRQAGFSEFLAATSLPEAWNRFGPPDLCAIEASHVGCR